MAAAASHEPAPSRWRYLVAIWFAIVGYFSGGMVAVLIAKVVGFLNRCTPPEGFPACDFESYFRVGTLLGALSLPGLIIWRMWQSDARRRHAQRG